MTDFKTVAELEGKTITKVEHNDEEVVIETREGPRYRMYRDQDCCESVVLEEIRGNIADILNTPVLKTVENESNVSYSQHSESRTDTDFTVTTERGDVVFHWVGESNGYYSESVYFTEIK